MDEEQGLGSPISGSLRGIRRSVSSGIFTGRALPQFTQPDPQTTSLISQNSLTLTTVSNQLSNISSQIINLNTSLSTIRENLQISDSLDRAREAEQRKRERILAEQALREGKESDLEKKIQFALLSPVRRVAAKTQSILNQLAEFFTVLLGGWLANTTLQFLNILSEKNIDKFNAFKRKLGADLLTIGGIFLVATVGIKKLISLSASIASNAFRITFGAILKKPFQAIINTVRNLLTGARNKVGKFVAEAGEGLLKNIGRGLLGALPFVASGTQLDLDAPPDKVTGIKSGAKVTGEVADNVTGNVSKTKKGFFSRFGKQTAKEGAEVGTKKVAKFGLRKILGKLFGPVTNFLVDMAFGEKLERALAGAAGFAAGSAVVAKLASPLLISPDPFTKILYGALVLGGGFLGEAGAKSLVDGVMSIFGKKTTKAEKIEPASTSTVNEEDIQKEEPISLDGISLALGGDDSNLINPIDTNRNLIATNLSSLEEPSPNIVTLPMGGDVMNDSGGSSNPPSTPSNEIPPITSTDGSNPYISFSESIYGVLA